MTFLQTSFWINLNLLHKCLKQVVILHTHKEKYLAHNIFKLCNDAHLKIPWHFQVFFYERGNLYCSKFTSCFSAHISCWIIPSINPDEGETPGTHGTEAWISICLRSQQAQKTSGLPWTTATWEGDWLLAEHHKQIPVFLSVSGLPDTDSLLIRARCTVSENSARLNQRHSFSRMRVIKGK